MRKKSSQHLSSKPHELRIPLSAVTIGLVMALCAATIVGSLYFFSKKTFLTPSVDSPRAKADAEISKLVKEVGALVVLPQEEKPTVATVSDKTKLQGQPFFSRAENGDKVLIYTNAKKAILYRPSVKKVVEMSPFMLSNQNSSASSQGAISPTSVPTKMQSVTVSIYNGTKIPNLASNTEAKLLKEFSNIEIVKKANAENDYKKTVVIDVSKKNKTLAEELAKKLQGIVIDMPSDEIIPDSDILVIVGE